MQPDVCQEGVEPGSSTISTPTPNEALVSEIQAASLTVLPSTPTQAGQPERQSSDSFDVKNL
jgi:hypothetical protein